MASNRISSIRVAIYILNWNRSHDSLRLLNSLQHQTHKNIEVYVVDNASEKNDFLKLKRGASNAKVFQTSENLGCPGGRNFLVNSIASDFIFFVDNDGLLRNDAIENSLRSYLESDFPAVLGGVVVGHEDLDSVCLKSEPWVGKSRVAKNYSGGVALINTELFLAAGGYDARFMYGHEESDLTIRLFGLSHSVVISEDVVLYHAPSPLGRIADQEIAKLQNVIVTAFKNYNFIIAFPYIVYVFIRYYIRARVRMHGKPSRGLVKLIISTKRRPLSFSKTWKYIWMK